MKPKESGIAPRSRVRARYLPPRLLFLEAGTLSSSLRSALTLLTRKDRTRRGPVRGSGKGPGRGPRDTLQGPGTVETEGVSDGTIE